MNGGPRDHSQECLDAAFMHHAATGGDRECIASCPAVATRYCCARGHETLLWVEAGASIPCMAIGCDLWAHRIPS